MPLDYTVSLDILRRVFGRFCFVFLSDLSCFPNERERMKYFTTALLLFVVTEINAFRVSEFEKLERTMAVHIGAIALSAMSLFRSLRVFSSSCRFSLSHLSALAKNILCLFVFLLSFCWLLLLLLRLVSRLHTLLRLWQLCIIPKDIRPIYRAGRLICIRGAVTLNLSARSSICEPHMRCQR